MVQEATEHRFANLFSSPTHPCHKLPDRKAYRDALKLQDPEESPEGWAITQNNLASALDAQAYATPGEEGVRLYNEKTEDKKDKGER